MTAAEYFDFVIHSNGLTCPPTVSTMTVEQWPLLALLTFDSLVLLDALLSLSSLWNKNRVNPTVNSDAAIIKYKFKRDDDDDDRFQEIPAIQEAGWENVNEDFAMPPVIYSNILQNSPASQWSADI